MQPNNRSGLTREHQQRAVRLLKKCLKLKEQFEEGNGVSGEEDDRHTTDVRRFLIEIGANPDRRKN